jgi:hypothetical protein
VNPGTLPDEPTYVRNFDGAFFYFLQSIINEKWELVVKYDWYDANVKVSGKGLGKTGTNFSAADVKFSTTGVGLTRYVAPDLKVLVYYDIVHNEETALPQYTDDIKDNTFTFRIQMRF